MCPAPPFHPHLVAPLHLPGWLPSRSFLSSFPTRHCKVLKTFIKNAYYEKTMLAFFIIAPQKNSYFNSIFHALFESPLMHEVGEFYLVQESFMSLFLQKCVYLWAGSVMFPSLFPYTWHDAEKKVVHWVFWEWMNEYMSEWMNDALVPLAHG